MSGEIVKNRDYYEDEIDLRELILVVWNGRKLLSLVVLLCLVITLAYTFIQSESYIGKKTLSLKQISEQSIIDMDNYVSLIKTDRILQLTLNELQWTNDEGELLRVQDMDNLLKVNRIEETDLVELKIKLNEKNKVTDFLTVIENVLKREIYKNDTFNIDQMIKIVKEQLINQKKVLEEKTENIQLFLDENGNLDELKKQIQNLKSIIGVIDYELLQLNMEVEINEEALSKLEKIVDFDKKNFNNNFTINNNTDEFIIEGIGDISNSLTIAKYTKIRNDLIISKENQIVKEKELEILRKRLYEKEAKLLKIEYKYQSLMEEYKIAQSQYNNFLVEAKSLETKKSKGIVSINMVSESEPTVVSTDKKLILMIGLVLGVFLGVFVVFIKEFIKSVTDENEAESIKNSIGNN